jgi:hypothetical protein
MTENVLNDTTNAVFIPTIISQKCLQRLGSYLSLTKNVSKDNEWTTATVGKVISVPKTGAVTANDKTAGNVYTKQNPTGTNVNVTLDQHKEVTITIDDVTKVLENQDTQMRYANDAAIAIAEAIESKVLSLHAQIQNTVTWDRTSAATIDASLLRVRKFFTDQKVPLLEQRFMYVDSSVYNDLLGVDKYTRFDARGEASAILNGETLRTYGLTIGESQLVPTTGSPVAYHNLAYTRDAFIVASRPLGKPQGFGGNAAVINDPMTGLSLRTLFWYNADLGAHQLTIEVLFGVSILDQRRVVEIESF